jgi:hypothetical protein
MRFREYTLILFTGNRSESPIIASMGLTAIDRAQTGAVACENWEPLCPVRSTPLKFPA